MFKVSVITPVYNHEKYIAECIESVLAQTWQDWEMIIVDDGSTDRTAEIAGGYAGKDNRIRFIRQENIGIFRLAETYNKALSVSTGEYIAILEGDDYWEPKKLKAQVEAMLKEPDAVLCWGKSAARIGNNRENHQVFPVHIERNRAFYDNDPPCKILNALLDDFPTPLTYLIRKSALMKTGGFIQILPLPAVDLATLLALSRMGKFTFIDQILGTWRISMDQVTKNYTDDLLEGSRNIYLSHYRQLSEQERKHCIINEKSINHRFKKKEIISLTRSGRFKLIRKDFKGARADYWKAIRSHGLTEPVWKLRALTGFLFGFFKMDVEGLAKWLGKGSLK